MDTDDAGTGVRARADLLTALILVALGLGVLYFSWTMPRLEERRIHPATIPGLVPMALGAALALCGALLAWRSAKIHAPGGWSALFGLVTSSEARRVGAILALAFTYTLVLVGWLPFWAASMIFIFAFILVFETWLTPDPIPVIRSAIWALPIALIAGGGIFYVFERIFLVRLP